jgi:hypothetical protein
MKISITFRLLKTHYSSSLRLTNIIIKLQERRNLEGGSGENNIKIGILREE